MAQAPCQSESLLYTVGTFCRLVHIGLTRTGQQPFYSKRVRKLLAVCELVQKFPEVPRSTTRGTAFAKWRCWMKSSEEES